MSLFCPKKLIMVFNIIFSKNLVENGLHASSVTDETLRLSYVALFEIPFIVFLFLKIPQGHSVYLWKFRISQYFFVQSFLCFCFGHTVFGGLFQSGNTSFFRPMKFKNFSLCLFPAIFLWSFSSKVLNICPNFFLYAFMCWSFYTSLEWGKLHSTLWQNIFLSSMWIVHHSTFIFPYHILSSGIKFSVSKVSN